MDAVLANDDYDCIDLFESVFGAFSNIRKHEIPGFVQAIMEDPTKSRELKWAASKFLDNENGICHPYISDILRQMHFHLRKGNYYVRPTMHQNRPFNQTVYQGTPEHNVTSSRLTWAPNRRTAPELQRTQKRKQLEFDEDHEYKRSRYHEEPVSDAETELVSSDSETEIVDN